MRGGTLFSGIGAPEVSAPGIEWQWCAEIDPFACAVLANRFPHVLNLGDVMEIDPDAVEPVDLVVFGSPCQSFSVAGKRLGLDDPRGNLALVALRLVSLIRPRWLVFENVPGLLSSDGGRDFGAFLGLLGECGYGWAYRILDAQHFGVPQRRRRVFVVGCLGDWRSAAAVLFEPTSLRRYPAPRREAGEGTPDSAPSGAVSSKWAKGTGGPAGDECYNRITSDVAPPCTSNPYGDHESREGLLIAFDARNGVETGDTTIAVQSGGDVKRGYSLNTVPLAFHSNAGRDFSADEDRSPPLRSEGIGGISGVAIAYDVTGAPATNGAKQTEIHTALRARPPGHSEASTTTVVAVPILEVGKRTNGDGYRDGDGFGKDGDPMFTLQGGAQHGVAFNIFPGARDRKDDIHAVPTETARAVNCNPDPALHQGGTVIAHALRADGFDASEDGTGRGTPLVPVSFRHNASFAEHGIDIAGTLQAENPHAVALPFDTTQVTSKLNRSVPRPGDPCHPLAQSAHAPAVAVPRLDTHLGGEVTSSIDSNYGKGAGGRGPAERPVVAIASAMSVRRLTPRECERLQGMPDDWTLVPYRGKPAADGPRYRAVGNSMAVPVIGWILGRIRDFEQ